MQTEKATINGEKYPFLLRHIFDAPDMLFYKGTLPKNNSLLLAVVGSRKMTSYGKIALEHILPPLVSAGIEIVSGLAYGVDAEAHRLTLEHNGKAHAIIGSGLDKESFYPKKHLPLARDIIKNGGSVISEYDNGTPALPRHFAIRDRLIAGMSHAALIVEAAERSGSLITATCALNEGREVFAVPGPINVITSKGTNTLIKNGAHCVTNAEDILHFFNLETESYSSKKRSENKDALLTLIESEAKHINDISKQLNLTVSETSARLSKLEIAGLVKNLGNMHYIKK